MPGQTKKINPGRAFRLFYSEGKKMNYSIELIRPINKEKEYGFQINSKKFSWSFFAVLNLTKTRKNYKRPFFKFEICKYYGRMLKIGKFHFQFTVWGKA
jgi:hypothetical protein